MRGVSFCFPAHRKAVSRYDLSWGHDSKCNEFCGTNEVLETTDPAQSEQLVDASVEWEFGFRPCVHHLLVWTSDHPLRHSTVDQRDRRFFRIFSVLFMSNSVTAGVAIGMCLALDGNSLPVELVAPACELRGWQHRPSVFFLLIRHTDHPSTDQPSAVVSGSARAPYRLLTWRTARFRARSAFSPDRPPGAMRVLYGIASCAKKFVRNAAMHSEKQKIKDTTVCAAERIRNGAQLWHFHNSLWVCTTHCAYGLDGQKRWQMIF